MCIILVRSSSKDCSAIYILVLSLLKHTRTEKKNLRMILKKQLAIHVYGSL